MEFQILYIEAILCQHILGPALLPPLPPGSGAPPPPPPVYYVLSTNSPDASENDGVYLHQKQDGHDLRQLWEKVGLKDGWLKFRQPSSNFILDLRENTKQLYVSHNLSPCQGRKQCLR